MATARPVWMDGLENFFGFLMAVALGNATAAPADARSLVSVLRISNFLSKVYFDHDYSGLYAGTPPL